MHDMAIVKTMGRVTHHFCCNFIMSNNKRIHYASKLCYNLIYYIGESIVFLGPYTLVNGLDMFIIFIFPTYLYC